MRTRRCLDQELVRRHLCADLDEANALIQAHRVTVGGAIALDRQRRVAPDDSIGLLAAKTRFVSRGGEKLHAALEAFGIDVTGMRVLDAGASTGGFTSCLLQHGVAHVYAVDVGHGQLAWSLQQDARVSVFDRTNVRSLTADDLGGPVDAVVADLSFIRLAAVVPALLGCAKSNATFVFLVKPQFESHRDEIGEGGIVRNAEVRERIVRRTIQELADAGLVVTDLIVSPLRGATGNVEYLVNAARSGEPLPEVRLVEQLRVKIECLEVDESPELAEGSAATGSPNVEGAAS